MSPEQSVSLNLGKIPHYHGYKVFPYIKGFELVVFARRIWHQAMSCPAPTAKPVAASKHHQARYPTGKYGHIWYL